MNTITLLLLLIAITGYTDDENQDWNDTDKYIGKYSRETDFFENPVIENELLRILGNDYESYMEHVSMSGCGEICNRYGLIYGSVSQMNIGGYSSLFFIDTSTRKMYLFWLKEAVLDKKYTIFGDKPVPADILSIIEQEMNVTWGHVANFSVLDGKILIEINKDTQ